MAKSYQKMGNAGSAGPPRDRQKSSETAPSSPMKEGQAFIFDKVPDKVGFHAPHDDEEPYFTKPTVAYNRPRANTGIFHRKPELFVSFNFN